MILETEKKSYSRFSLLASIHLPEFLPLVGYNAFGFNSLLRAIWAARRFSRVRRTYHYRIHDGASA